MERVFKAFVNNDRKIVYSPLTSSLQQKDAISPLLQLYPELLHSIRQFCNSNLPILPVNFVTEDINACIAYLMEYSSLSHENDGDFTETLSIELYEQFKKIALEIENKEEDFREQSNNNKQTNKTLKKHNLLHLICLIFGSS